MTKIDASFVMEYDIFARPIYAGNALCTVRYTGLNPCMVSIRSTSFAPPSIPTNVDFNAAPISQVDLSTFNKGIVCFFLFCYSTIHISFDFRTMVAILRSHHHGFILFVSS